MGINVAFVSDYTSGKSAAQGFVRKSGEVLTSVKALVAFALYGDPAETEDFAGLKSAGNNASNLKSIAMLGEGLTDKERDAILKAAFASDASQFGDFLIFIRSCRVKEGKETSWRTGRGETAKVNPEALVKPTAANIAKAAPALAERKRERQSSHANVAARDKANKQPQAKPTKTADAPAEVMSTNKVIWNTAIAALTKTASVAKWPRGSMTDKARESFATQMAFLTKLGEYIQD